MPPTPIGSATVVATPIRVGAVEQSPPHTSPGGEELSVEGGRSARGRPDSRRRQPDPRVSALQPSAVVPEGFGVAAVGFEVERGQTRSPPPPVAHEAVPTRLHREDGLPRLLLQLLLVLLGERRDIRRVRTASPPDPSPGRSLAGWSARHRLGTSGSTGRTSGRRRGNARSRSRSRRPSTDRQPHVRVQELSLLAVVAVFLEDR